MTILSGTAKRLRPSQIIGEPIELDEAYPDPKAVYDFMKESAPYALAAKILGFSAADIEASGPWFRRYWARDGKLLEPPAKLVFDNETFVRSGKQLFDVDVVIPWSVMNNINCPSPDGGPHCDLPTFVIGGGVQPPEWLRMVMGYSGLFAEWAVPVAAAISWFYRGEGGELEYWPDGPNRPSCLSSSSKWNTALVADNDYMPHRVVAHGPKEKRGFKVSQDAVIGWSDADGWNISADGNPIAKFPEEEVRISILWKGLAFNGADDADDFFQKRSSLDISRIVKMINAHMRELNLPVPNTENPLTDPEWRRCVEQLRNHIGGT